MKCPKCAIGSMTGPIYSEINGGYYSERLIYRCSKCGYSKSEPTADSKEKGEGDIKKFLVEQNKKTND